MQDYKYILFDLDGTVIDSSPGITNSCMYALRKMGIEPPKREELYCFIGPPLTESFSKYYGMSDDEATQAVAFYREYYKDTGIFEITPYPGIEELFASLTKSEKKVVLATSKPELFAKRIIEHLGFDKYFSFIAGSLVDKSREKKADVIRYALDSLGVTDISECLMVGDREHDIKGAAALGMDACGVLHGFGSIEEFKECNAKYIVKDSFELLDMLTK